MYRLGLESILGLERRGACFGIAPCIPGAWDGFTVEWRHGRSWRHWKDPERQLARMDVALVQLDELVEVLQQAVTEDERVCGIFDQLVFELIDGRPLE